MTSVWQLAIVCVLGLGQVEAEPADSASGGAPRRARETDVPNRLDPYITIVLRDGRELTGVVDSATDDRSLWLRDDQPRSSFSAQYRWEQIVTLRHDGQAVPRRRRKSLARELSSDFPWQRLDRLRAEQRSAESQPPREAALAGDAPAPSELSFPARSQGRVATIRVRAQVANWDADLEADGLQLVLECRDQAGRLIAVDGQLSVRLWTEQTDRRGQVRLVDVGTWNERIASNQFTAGAVHRMLPFHRYFPDKDLSLASQGELEVTLLVRGQQRLTATNSVYLRSLSRLRDRLQQRTGSRFR